LTRHRPPGGNHPGSGRLYTGNHRVSTTTTPFPSTDEEQPAASNTLACPWCGQLHTRIALRPGETGKCVRCDAQLAVGRTSNWVVTLAWAITGLILWVPANLLPIVSVSQFGHTHESLLATGVTTLWQQGMPWVAVLVALCGIAAPLLLLLTLSALLLPITLGRPSTRLRLLVRWLRAVELWSIPEVYLLGVLVAFIKLGDVVRSLPGPGLWCHIGMALALFVAWRRFDIDATAQALADGRADGGGT
jgi:paraquat-inducible protein A